MQEMVEQEVFTTGLKLLTSDVVGFMPIVPAVIAGLPECMLNRSISEIEASNTPIKIYAVTSISSGLSYAQITNRGIAILGLAMAFANIRPIELYLVSMGDYAEIGECVGAVVRLETKPLDYARAAYMITSPTYARKIMHTMYKINSNKPNKLSSYIPFAWGLNPIDPEYETNMREMLQMEAQDIFITGGSIPDQSMLTNPIQWVKDMIAKHNEAPEYV